MFLPQNRQWRQRKKTARVMSEIPDGAVSVNASGAVLISVLATPRASRSALAGWHDGRLKVALAAPPVDGEANKALVKFIAEILNVAKSAVSVASGATGRRKVVAVNTLSAAEVCGKLSQMMNK